MSNPPASEELQCFGTVLKEKSKRTYIGHGPEGIMITLRELPSYGWRARLRASVLQWRFVADGHTKAETLAQLERQVSLRVTRAKAQRECLERLGASYLESNKP